jgi:DNA-binding IclR family transcriptional regulator
MSNEAPSNVQSVDRALTILETLARSGEAGVTDLAAALEVHKSTAFRLVATLEAHGLVEQVDGRGKYRLGIGLLRLAGATTARLDVVQEARPISRKLAADTGETVNVAVLAERSALYLDQVAGSSALQSHNWVGQHIPLHATANGKVLLLDLDEERWVEMLGRLQAYTERTITTRDRFRKELAQVREQGYAVAVDELELGLAAVAAPIHNAHGDVIASMSVSGPTFRLTEERIDEIVPMLCEAAEEVSHRLGWGHR